ncbi:MAG: hypothetical protein WCF18_08870 [Chthoniobacteraceae bacterium]
MLFEKMTEVLDPEPHGAALNMAVDELLLRAAREPVLRVYRWDRPAISFGYFEKFAALSGRAHEREMVRRWTGGGVVVHGDDVTYTLIAPASHPFARLPAGESYRQIHGAIALALRGNGVETSLAASSSAKISSGCFENPAEADVLAGERKVAGAAQRRTRWGLLHQGSIQGIAIAEDFTTRLASVFAAEIERRDLSRTELAEAETLAEEKYGSDVWLRRF